MENLLNYVNLRKDISFSQTAFNPVDMLVFADLAYVNWDGIVNEEEVSLNEACKEFIDRHTKGEINNEFAFSPRLCELVTSLIHNDRYKNIKIKGYRQVNNVEETIQFGVVTFVLEDSSLVVSYRGTDSSIRGWKENLSMTYALDIPCQILAKEYLRDVVLESPIESSSWFGFKKKKEYPNIYVTGHSKGGNLAMYSYLKNGDIQEHITSVYSFDGNGFLPEFWDGLNPDKIVNYIPRASLVGRLMSHKEEYKIMDATSSGLSQHDSFNWSVSYNDFNYADALDEESEVTLKKIDEILLSKTIEQRKTYTDLIGVFFDKMEIYSITDMNELSIRQALSGLKELKGLSVDEVKFLVDIVRFIIEQSGPILKGMK
jgi:hypothetical protein